MFLFPWATGPSDVAKGGEGLGDPVLLEPSTSSLSRLSSASRASLSEAVSWGSSPASGSGGLEERKTCFYKGNTSGEFKEAEQVLNAQNSTSNLG
jgi:hypothetical protein